MEYYFTKKNNVDPEKSELIVDDFEYKHLVKVLRKNTGDEITITDGERNVYNCIIKKIEKSKIICSIEKTSYNLSELSVDLKLYLSPLRNTSRFEFAVEKAVELGVNSIHPVITEYTVNKNIFSRAKTERLNRIIIGAIGQSQRCLLPKISEAVTFEKMIEETSADENKIVMYELSDDSSDIKLLDKSKGLLLMIGPEGGFSNSEIKLLMKNNWQVRSLGKRKIRAETAVIVSVFDIISKLNKNET